MALFRIQTLHYTLCIWNIDYYVISIILNTQTSRIMETSRHFHLSLWVTWYCIDKIARPIYDVMCIVIFHAIIIIRLWCVISPKKMRIFGCHTWICTIPSYVLFVFLISLSFSLLHTLFLPFNSFFFLFTCSIDIMSFWFLVRAK